MADTNDDNPKYELSADEEKQQRADRRLKFGGYEIPMPYSIPKRQGGDFPLRVPKPYSNPFAKKD
jgi:hypothetical protein